MKNILKIRLYHATAVLMSKNQTFDPTEIVTNLFPKAGIKCVYD